MLNKYYKIKHVLPLVALFCLLAGDISYGRSMEVATPSPEMVKQVIHNKGNIVTTVDNWGYMGGYSYYDYPSCEWPKSSGHDYLGEMKYWMGAVTPTGDTISVTTDDDFQPIPSLISGTSSYSIHLSTDTTSYDYNSADTTGLGLGNPAYGWRIWNPDSSNWIYNLNYWAADSSFHKGGPTSLQQSFYRFEDGVRPISLGLQMSQTIYQWDYCYNQDLLFVVLQITNTSGLDYNNFAFAIYADFDVGGPDGTGENGRLGDKVGNDTVNNLAWTYDADGYDPGWGPLVQTGIMGTKYLETPDGIGMTSFRNLQWENMPTDDAGRYEVLTSSQFDTSLDPTDQVYLQCTRGINLTAGKTVQVVFAIVAGQDLSELYDNAVTAQTLYDNHFVGPQPPAMPTLKALVGDKRVHLSWNDTSEVSTDPLTGQHDFMGYKLYRSSNNGYTWGFVSDVDNACLETDYVPVAAYQIESYGDPIMHTFVDSNLTNGMEYWYCLVSYDSGDTTVPISALQNGFGTPGSDLNAVKVVPRSDAAGSYNVTSTLKHTAVGDATPSDGVVYPVLFDGSWVSGQEYRVVFSETDEQTFWHLINYTTGDTALKDQTLQDGELKLYEVVDGMRVVVNNGERVPRMYAQTGFSSPGDTTLHLGYSYESFCDTYGYPRGSDKHFRSTYEIRFTDSGSTGYLIDDDVTPIELPFEVWNVTLGYQVQAEILDRYYDGIWSPQDRDYICIVNVPYDSAPHPEVFPYNFVWYFRFATTDTAYAVGDIFTVAGAPVNGADDIFSFKTDGISASAAAVDMSKIKVVPNPYIAHANWETNQYQRKLQFIHLPDKCTVRIYTLAGDLVRTLTHSDGTGATDWDMLSEYGLEISPGIYLYHVDSQYGNRMGRFAVIK
jgi:hypothetical protein